MARIFCPTLSHPIETKVGFLVVRRLRRRNAVGNGGDSSTDGDRIDDDEEKEEEEDVVDESIVCAVAIATWDLAQGTDVPSPR